MLSVVVNNIKRKEELDFKERIRQTMIKQIRKKILGQENESRLNKSCDAPVYSNNSIQHLKETV